MGWKRDLCETNMVFMDKQYKIYYNIYIYYICACISCSACTPETSIAGQWIKTRLVETINQNLINLRFVFTIMLCVIVCCVGHVAWVQRNCDGR